MKISIQGLLLSAILTIVFAGTARTIDAQDMLPYTNHEIAEGADILHYDGKGNLDQISEKLADGTTVDERINELGDLISARFYRPDEKPVEFDFGQPDIWKIPLVTMSDGKGASKPVQFHDIQRFGDNAPPIKCSFNPFGSALLISPDGTGTTFPSPTFSSKSGELDSAVVWAQLNKMASSTLMSHIRFNLGTDSLAFTPGKFKLGFPLCTPNFIPFTIYDDLHHFNVYGFLPAVPHGMLKEGKITTPCTPTTFYVPQIGQAGKPVFVTGPFGDDAGVHVKFNGDPVNITGQSSTAIMFSLPSDIFGTTNLHIDGDGYHINVKHTSIGIKLISDDRILKPGERDAFRCRVSGLDDLPAPVKVNIVDQEPYIVAMDAGAHVSFTITPGSGSTVSKDYGLTAIQKGAADIVAWVPQLWYDASYTKDGQVAEDDSTTTGGTIEVDTGGTTGSTVGGTTGTTIDTTGDTTGGTTGGTTGSTSGSTTGDTTGSTTGDTTGSTTGKSTGETRPVGIVTAGWFEPCQGVWQDDKNFPDKPTKQLTKLSDTSYKAELKMVVGRHTKLYGLRGDNHTMIVIKGETNRSIELDVRFRFTLTENGKPPRVLYIEPAAHNKAYVDGPVDKSIHKFNATLNAYDGVGLTNKNDSWQFTTTGPYTIVADLIKPDGSPTGLSVSVFGEVVKTLPPKVYFYPMIWTEPSGSMHDALADLKKTTSQLADACANNIPIYYPLADKDFHTQALDPINYTDDIKRIDKKWTVWDASWSKDWRVENVVPVLTRKLTAMAYQEKAGRIVCVLPRPDFKAIKDMEDVAAFSQTQKVIFVPDTATYATIAHEYVHTTPFLWSADEMEKEFGFSYHNDDDKSYANGAEIFDGSFEKRMDDKPAIMGKTKLDKWITQGTYWHLIGEFLNPHDPPVTVVTGYLKNDNGVDASIAPLYQMMGEVDLPEGPGDWEIQLRGPDGSVQHRYGFTPHWQLPDLTNPVSYLGFGYRVPYQSTTAEIDIAGPGGKILDSRKISRDAPEVSITTPTDGTAVHIHDGKITVKWTGSDPDGTPLLYSVLYSPNDGEDWYSEAFEISGTTAEIPLEGGTAKPRVKVIATNGSRSYEAEAGFTLAP